MQSTACQKSRSFTALGAVSVAPEGAGVGIRHVDQIGQRSILPNHHHGLESLVDREAERSGIDAHAGGIGFQGRAAFGECERLSKFARDRIARISAERRAAEAARQQRRRKATLPQIHCIRPPIVEPAGAKTRRGLDVISRERATEVATIVGLLIFLIAIAMASFGAMGAGAGVFTVIAATD